MILIHAIKMCHRVGVYAIFVQSLNFSVKLCFSDRCCSQFVTYVCQWCVSDPSICVSSPQPIVWPLLIYWRHFCNGQSWRNLIFHLVANINLIELFYHSLIVHLSLAEPAWLCENKKGLRTVYLSLNLFREVETNFRDAYVIWHISDMLLIWRSNSRKESGCWCCLREGSSWQRWCWSSPPPPSASPWQPPRLLCLLLPHSALFFASGHWDWPGRAWNLIRGYKVEII